MAYQPPWQNEQGRRDFLRAQLDARIAERRAQGYGRADFNNLLKPVNRALEREQKKQIGDKIAEAEHGKKGPSKGQIKNALKSGKTLHVTTASDCFDNIVAVRSKDDPDSVLVTATFKNKTAGDWQYEMDLDLFLTWANDDLGRFFNDVIRGAYEA